MTSGQGVNRALDMQDGVAILLPPELEFASSHKAALLPYSDLAVVCLIWPCCTCHRYQCPAVELVVLKALLYGLWPHAKEFFFFFFFLWLCFVFSLEAYFWSPLVF